MVTPFVGRRDEVAATRRLLGGTPLLTLAGPPGVGKTRLALHVAQEAARGFPDGVRVVDLAGLRDAALVAQEVARGLGLHDASTRWAVDGLAQHIGDRTLLLVLDNCEHLLDACAVLVGSLARACPNLRVLATSRQPLGVGGETVLRVPPLPVPAEGAVEAEAVDLLLARARAADPGYVVDAAELDRVAELCRRLDGIPLALELAAVRLRTLTTAQMLERLDDRFALLGRGSRTAPAHQRTLRAALDWSRDLAGDEERVLWRRLAVFPTSFELTAVEAVCAGEGLPRDRVLDALDGLVDKSIAGAVRARRAMRYRLLDSIREYGGEALRAAGEAGPLRDRHAAHYADLCAQAWRHWTDAEQPAWFDRLDAEHDNLRAALDVLRERDPEAGCAMAADLWLYWEARGHLTEGRRRLAALLEAAPADASLRPRTLWVAGYLALAQSDVPAALPLLRAAVDGGTAAGDTDAVAFATQYLGLCHLFAGELPAAEEALGHAVALHRGLGNRAAAFALADLAVTAMLAGDLDRAVALYDDVLAVTADGGDPWTRSHALWGLGVARFRRGELDLAARAEEDALRLIGGLDERSGIALCLEALAWVAAARGDLVRAARLQGAAAAVWTSIPGRLPAPFQGQAEDCARRTTAGLGRAHRDRLLAEGRGLDRRAAVALGLGEPPPGVPEAHRPHGLDPLSAREREVARLVAQGLTDRQIASRLVVSQRTAESHVQHIRTKLGFRSRAQIAAWVAEQQ